MANLNLMPQGFRPGGDYDWATGGGTGGDDPRRARPAAASSTGVARPYMGGAITRPGGRRAQQARTTVTINPQAAAAPRGGPRPTRGGGGGGGRGGTGSASMRQGIIDAARALGISPLDLATTISYETAGTFDPAKRGPTTQWGQHRGLIQFGEPQARQYGVDWDNAEGSQLGADGAIVKYLRATGVRPGMGLLNVYAAINAGGATRFNASDANNGGAPGTVRDKVNNQMGDHRANAARRFGFEETREFGGPVEMRKGGKVQMAEGGLALPEGAPDPTDPRWAAYLAANPWLGRILEGVDNDVRTTVGNQLIEGGFPRVLPIPANGNQFPDGRPRANYRSGQNRIEANTLGNLTAETAHAIQFRNDRLRGIPLVGTGLSNIRSSLALARDHIRGGGREEAYDVPGGLENVAHTTIQPRLEAQIRATAARSWTPEKRAQANANAPRASVRRRVVHRKKGGPVDELELGGKLGQAAGTAAGSALIPIPVVGGMVGGMVGGVAGNLAEMGIMSLLDKSPDRLITPEDGMANQGNTYKSGGPVRKYEGGGTITPEELRRRVRASVASARRARTPGVVQRMRMGLQEKVNADRALTSGSVYDREEQSLRDAEINAQRGDTADAYQRANPGGNLGRYAGLGQVRSMEEGGPVGGDKGRARGDSTTAAILRHRRRRLAALSGDYSPEAIRERAEIQQALNTASAGQTPQAPGTGLTPPTMRPGLAGYRAPQRDGVERFAQGGQMPQPQDAAGAVPIGQDAVRFEGPSHEGGGIPLPGANAEVEGGETMDQAMGGDYIFSDSIKVPGTDMTFAQAHEEMVKAGASPQDVEKLAALQEKVSGREGGAPEGAPQQGAAQQAGQMQPGMPPGKAQGPEMMDGGGPLDPIAPRMPGMAPLDMTAVGTSGNIVDYQGPGMMGGALAGLKGYAKSPGFQRDTPHLLNVARGIFGRDTTPAAAKVNTSYLDRIRLPSPAAALASVDAATRGLGLNPGASLAEKAIANSAAIKGKAEIMAGHTQAEAGLQQQIMGARGQAAGQDAQLAEAYRQDKMGATAAKEAMVSSGFAGMRAERQLQTQNANLAKMNDTALIMSLSNMPPEAAGPFFDFLTESGEGERATRMRGQYERARAKNPVPVAAPEGVATPATPATAPMAVSQSGPVAAPAVASTGATTEAPAPPAVPDAGATTPEVMPTGSHTVVRGDTLGEMAKTYGVTVEDLMRWNPSIRSRNTISRGARLVVPHLAQ